MKIIVALAQIQISMGRILNKLHSNNCLCLARQHCIMSWPINSPHTRVLIGNFASLKLSIVPIDCYNSTTYKLIIFVLGSKKLPGPNKPVI